MKSDPFKNNIGYALRRASTAAMAELANQFSALDLRPTDASVLLHIGANPGIRQSEIGRMLDIRSANMAPLIARLDERGMIERKPVDGRSQGLSLSPQGVRLEADVRAEIDIHEARIHKVLPDGLEAEFFKTVKALWREFEA